MLRTLKKHLHRKDFLARKKKCRGNVGHKFDKRRLISSTTDDNDDAEKKFTLPSQIEKESARGSF